MPTPHRVIIVANQSIFMRHVTGPYHPESPQRVEVIERALKHARLMTPENSVNPRKATVAEISLCHDKEYQDELRRQIENLKKMGIQSSSFDNTKCFIQDVQGDFQISPETWEVALYAAGSPLTAIEMILDKNNHTSRAFCIVRPPGHHAHQHSGSGFCIFNHVAIAAKHLTQNLGFKRVLIVDWDAHHGDGTQELTERDDKIFYFSTHKETSSGFYPGPHWGKMEQQGFGDARGTLLNCPVEGSKNECREGILRAFKHQLVPAMEKYRPEFVLISCGFDAHENDSLVGLGLKNEDFGELTLICMSIAEKYANGHIVSVLEGGYNLVAIAQAATIHVNTLHL